MTSLIKREDAEKMDTAEVFSELLSAISGDLWDGMQSKSCQKNEKLLREIFDERMKKYNVDGF